MSERSPRSTGRAPVPPGAALVGIAAFVLVLLRQPHALLRPQFVWEETSAFWAASFVMPPIQYVFEPWAGYYQVVPRLAFLIAHSFPSTLAPVVTIAIHAALVAAVAGALASERMAPAIPGASRIVFGLGIALLPFWEPFVSVLSAQWFLAFLAAGLSLVKPKAMDWPVLAVAGLSGLAAIIAAPLYFRGWLSRDFRDRRGLVLVGAGFVQTLSLTASGRSTVLTAEVVFPAVVLGLAVVPVLLAWKVTTPRRTMAAFAYMSVVTLLLGSVAMGISGRYLMVAAAFATLLVVSTPASVRRPFGIIARGTWAAVIVVGFPIAMPRTTDWPAAAMCIGGPIECTVTVEPREWSIDWSPSWRPPSGMDRRGMPVE